MRRLLALALLALAGPAWAAGTVTTTERTHDTYKVVKFAWTSSAGGAADATTTGIYCGKLDLFATDPDGTDVPTLNYDVLINDDDGIDVLAAAGANRSDTATQAVATGSLGAVCYSKLTLAVTNAGNAKKGVVLVFLR